MDTSTDTGIMPDPNAYLSPFQGGGARFLVVVATLLLIYSFIK